MTAWVWVKDMLNYSQFWDIPQNVVDDFLLLHQYFESTMIDDYQESYSLTDTSKSTSIEGCKHPQLLFYNPSHPKYHPSNFVNLKKLATYICNLTIHRFKNIYINLIL